MTEERIILFPASARSHDDAVSEPRRRRELPEADRTSAKRRTPRRRRQSTPWLQRNALTVAAVSILVALLGLGFGLLQVIMRPEPSAGPLASPQTEASATVQAGSIVRADMLAGSAPGQPGDGTASSPTSRDIVMTVKVIDPTYTVAAGDTLGKIATRFDTTVERIAALNNLADPRALRVGTKLIVPPPL